MLEPELRGLSPSSSRGSSWRRPPTTSCLLHALPSISCNKWRVVLKAASWSLPGRANGVFATVVTLLVPELKVPCVAAHDSLSELTGALQALAPKCLNWIISFVTVCVIRLNHHSTFRNAGSKYRR
jgi:hypothetical protein